MSTVKSAYASAATITCTIASKTSGQGQRSAAVDNSSNLYVDALLTFGVKIGTFSAPANFAVYAYASADDGTNFETGGSTDTAYNTIRGDEHGPCIVCACYTNTTVFWGVGTVAWAFRGGILPRNWGVILTQTNCGTLSSAEGDHAKKFQGVNISIV